MLKSQFQNPRLDLGLMVRPGAVLEGAHSRFSSSVVDMNLLVTWSNSPLAGGGFLGARSRRTSYEQILVTEFDVCGFNVMEEL